MPASAAFTGVPSGTAMLMPSLPPFAAEAGDDPAPRRPTEIGAGVLGHRARLARLLGGGFLLRGGGRGLGRLWLGRLGLGLSRQLLRSGLRRLDRLHGLSLDPCGLVGLLRRGGLPRRPRPPPEPAAMWSAAGEPASARAWPRPWRPEPPSGQGAGACSDRPSAAPWRPSWPGRGCFLGSPWPASSARV